MSFIWVTSILLANDFSKMYNNPNHYPYYETCLSTNTNNYNKCIKNTTRCDIYLYTTDRFSNLRGGPVDKFIVVSPFSNHRIKQMINIYTGFFDRKIGLLNTTVDCLILDDKIIYGNHINTYCGALIKSCGQMFITSTTNTFIKFTTYVLLYNMFLWFVFSI